MGIHDRSYYRDEPPPGLAPSWNNRSPVSMIIIICVIVQVLNLFINTQYGRLSDLLALQATDVSRPWMWWHLLSYGFAHDYSSITHLFFNMMALWFLGRAVEERYGWSEFWRIYLISVVFGGLVFLGAHQAYDQNASVVGASGAVLTVTMLFIFNYPKNIIYLYFIPVQAWVLGLIIVLSNFVFTSGARVAYDVHAAGIIFAALYYYGNLNFGFLQYWPGTFRLWRRKTFGPKLKKFDGGVGDTASSDDEASRADMLLEKIQQRGIDSLTPKEKKFLESYSQKVRQRQNSI